MESLTGSNCVRKNARDAGEFESRMLAYLSEVRFDGGTYARNNLFSKALSQLAEDVGQGRDLLRAEGPAAPAVDETAPDIKSGRLQKMSCWDNSEMTGISHYGTDLLKIRRIWDDRNTRPKRNLTCQLHSPGKPLRLFVKKLRGIS